MVGLGLSGVGLALVVAAWQAIHEVTSESQFAGPLVVVKTIWSDWNEVPALYYLDFQKGGIGVALVFTTVGVLIGVAVGAVIGIPLGVTIARIRLARLVLEPPLSLLGTLPLLILLPFITLWFGTARLAQSGLVILFVMLTVAFASASAAEVVSNHYADYAACLGASKQRVLWTVVLPAAGPTVIAALRVGLAAGWGWEAVAELLGGRSGIGRIIQLTAQLGAVADLMAAVVCLTLVALICDALLSSVGGYLVRWRE